MLILWLTNYDETQWNNYILIGSEPLKPFTESVFIWFSIPNTAVMQPGNKYQLNTMRSLIWVARQHEWWNWPRIFLKRGVGITFIAGSILMSLNQHPISWNKVGWNGYSILMTARLIWEFDWFEFQLVWLELFFKRPISRACIFCSVCLSNSR